VEINAQGKASPSCQTAQGFKNEKDVGFAARGLTPCALVSGKLAPSGDVAVTLSVSRETNG